ncbi:hypothetical protein C8J56DRAFT_885646 [Mycena floridula]|nr:hypothetical protein C8J56DRAFT_885646 [Mycena floridula]
MPKEGLKPKLADFRGPLAPIPRLKKPQADESESLMIAPELRPISTISSSPIPTQAYLEASEPRDAALTLLNIAFVSSYLNSDTNEISLIEQAKLELEILHNPKATQHWQHFLPSLSTLKNWLKKNTGQLRNTSTIDNADLARCLRELGRAYLRWGDYSKAIEHLTHAHELCPDLSFGGAQCAEHLARSHHCLQQNDEAEKWGLLALEEWQEMSGSDPSYVIWILGRIYISQGQYEQAIKYLTKALNIGKARNSEWDVAYALLELGRAEMKKGETQDAQISFTKALTHFSPLKGVKERVLCRFYLAKLEDPLKLPTEEECHALWKTWHDEDIPLYKRSNVFGSCQFSLLYQHIRQFVDLALRWLVGLRALCRHYGVKEKGSNYDIIEELQKHTPKQ